MSIFEETSQGASVTEGDRALQLFTDRHEALRRFAEYLNDDPPKKILFFYGDGGNGKSLLLKHLRERCCKRFNPDNWQYVRFLPDDEFAEHLIGVEGAEKIPSSYIDFGMLPRGEERPQETFSALLKMRRDLAGQGLHFAVFDFVCIWYLYRTGKLTQEKVKALFPTEELDLLTKLVEEIPGIGIIQSLFSILNKHAGERFTLYWHKRKLTEAQVQEIQRLDPEAELIDQLPRYFAQDLNASMALEEAPKRVVLFFDTHEAFWGHKERELAGDLFFVRDEWLRRLLGNLELSQGIVVIVAGRERPRWAKAPKTKGQIADRFLDPVVVGHLRTRDALSYLERAGVADAEMRQCLVTYAQVEPSQVHPFYLGLCADIVLTAAERGTPLTPQQFHEVPDAADRADELAQRLLRYVDENAKYAIWALSACRAFNREIYFELGQALRLRSTEADFSTLIRFSFVWHAGRYGQGWYRIHDLLRRLLRERGDEEVSKADRILEGYYRELSKADDPSALAEAIYHANQQEAKRGIKEWASTFEHALRRSRYDTCRRLLEIGPELRIPTIFELGSVSQCEGEYYFSLSRYPEAHQEYQEAIAAYTEALQRAPDDPDIHNNKGNTLCGLGDLQTGLAQHPEAEESYRQAIAACAEALQRAPDYVYAHSNKGVELQRLGELQARLTQHPEALESYQQAIAAYTEALRRAPDDPDIHNNKGNTLCGLGDLQTGLSQHPEAEESYRQAIAACAEALQRAPDDVVAHNNKGVALAGLGDLQAKIGESERAIASFTEALAEVSRALEVAPGDERMAAFKNELQQLIDSMSAERRS